MRTFYDIIKEVSNLRWSIVDPDPSSFEEVQRSVKLAIMQAHAYIWGLDDFPFKKKKTSIIAEKGVSTLIAPKGNITKVWIEGETTPLLQINSEDADFLSAQSGTPQKYWVDFGDEGALIHLYPTPQENTFVNIRYISNQMAKSHDGEPKANLEALDDFLNLPNDETVENIYMQCLNTKSMEYLVADDQDENYQPYIKEFNEAYRNLLKLTGTKIEPKLII